MNAGKRGRGSVRDSHQADTIPYLCTNALVEQPGVLATLSRWRSWVQIPSGALRSVNRRHGTQIGKAAKLKPC